MPVAGAEMCQLGSRCKWNWTDRAEKHEMVKTRGTRRSSWTTEPRTAGHAHQCHKCLPSCSCCLQQLLQVTVFRVMPYKEKLCQLFISTVQLTDNYWSKQRAIVKTTSYSLQHSEQHNKNYKEDWSSPQFKGKCSKLIWDLLQASLQQKLHYRIIEWLGLKETLKIM